MLMDVECNTPEEVEKIKKEKYPKPKKTNGQKRIIAGCIAMYCFLGACASMLPGFIARNVYDKDIRELDDKQTAIYEKFMASEEFSDTFKTEFTKASNDYANGLISYEEFDKKVKHLNSVKYAQEVLASSNNTELKSQVEEIEQQKEERSDKFGSSIAINLSLGGVIVGGTATMASATANMVYSLKEINEKKRKYASNKIKHQEVETGPVLIDKTSCNENCLGIRYYDSNTMTIRNTNGTVEKDEQNLTK